MQHQRLFCITSGNWDFGALLSWLHYIEHVKGFPLSKPRTSNTRKLVLTIHHIHKMYENNCNHRMGEKISIFQMSFAFRELNEAGYTLSGMMWGRIVFCLDATFM